MAVPPVLPCNFCHPDQQVCQKWLVGEQLSMDDMLSERLTNKQRKIEQYCAKGRIDLTCEQTSSSTVVQESYNTSVYKNVVEYYLAAVAAHLTFWVPISTICVGEGGIEGTLREGNINDKIIAI